VFTQGSHIAAFQACAERRRVRPRYPNGAKGDWPGSRYPNGITSFSPVLPMGSATPGNGSENGINPDRVASFDMGTRTRML